MQTSTEFSAGNVPVRVFISYAHESPSHRNSVARLWRLLRSSGIDAQLDAPASESPQDWPIWMLRQIRAATFTLVIASPSYKRSAEGDAPADVNRGAQWETRLIRTEFYEDQESGRLRFLPVVLPHCSVTDIPVWLGGFATTYYPITNYTSAGIEPLVRYMSKQPYVTTPPLGRLPTLAAAAPSLSGGREAKLTYATHIARLASNQFPSSPTLEAALRQLLVSKQFGLTDSDLGADPVKPGWIDVQATNLTLIAYINLRGAGRRIAAESYLLANVSDLADRAIVVTDGMVWLLYHADASGKLVLLSEKLLSHSSSDLESFAWWLSSLLAVHTDLTPTPELVNQTLGADSPAHALDYHELATLYARHYRMPNVSLKRALWAKLLRTAVGTHFSDDDSLFTNHTLLVLMGKIIGCMVIGIHVGEDDEDIVRMLSGAAFGDAAVYGVVEPDFFDWVAEVPGGKEFIRKLTIRLRRFAWQQTERDFIKPLYESIIDRETRHRLGEYYTPDWLAEEILTARVENPLTEKLLDPSCGSGTFLFHSVRRYLAAAEDAGLDLKEALSGLSRSVIGIDVHPVAVALARVNYLLAIGVDRVRSSQRGPITVPVYLGDSLRWSYETNLTNFESFCISTSDSHEIFVDVIHSSAEHLTFPSSIIDDLQTFEQLVSELTELATSRARNANPPRPDFIFDRLGIINGHRPQLTDTYFQLCRLHDANRDHIWSYYVRNLVRPLWLAQPENRIDILVGNPPWLAYRYMTRNQKNAFATMSGDRGLATDYSRVTNQDLSALFVVRSIEQYLAHGGKFAFVMPLSTLSRGQYDGFKTGRYPGPSETTTVQFSQPWDLGGIRPSFFPVKACVVFGVRALVGEGKALVDAAEVWTGRIPSNAIRSDVASRVSRALAEPLPVLGEPSLYGKKFSQGATLVPRMLFMVEEDETPPLGPGPGRIAVRSSRSAQEDKTWRAEDDLEGSIEQQFIKPVYSGSSVLPFLDAGPSVKAIVPWHEGRLLGRPRGNIERFRGLSKWWHRAEALVQARDEGRNVELIDKIDFRQKLTKQFPVPRIRVAYSASAQYVAAAILLDVESVVSHSLYWAAVDSMDEARYLTAILNSNALTTMVGPLQAEGENNPRHVDKYIWRLPIPLYDPDSSKHGELVALAERAERLVSDVQLPAIRFEAKRRRVRQHLMRDGIAAEIDAIVKMLIQHRPHTIASIGGE